ncbi:hypothetical protein HT031_005543 [Scenedesmus sp. PABB004]|nr:hypothetical protein HT031_005543 [Scenedesmus sp. PABB004]
MLSGAALAGALAAGAARGGPGAVASAALAAAAGLSTSAGPWAATAQLSRARTQGDLPKVPTLPQRSVLLRKLVALERALTPQAAAQAAGAVPGEAQQRRAARRTAARAYLAAVQAAAARQDVPALLAHLEAAAAAGRADGPAGAAGAGGGGAALAPLPAAASASLLSGAAAAAARGLADASGRPEHAQAFLELAVDRRLLAPPQLQRALHAVLAAYAARGDHRGALAAASRFYDTGAGGSLLPPGARPSSCTLALLLHSAAATREPDLLLGAWKYFWGQAALPPPVVLHALVHGAVTCDLAATRGGGGGHGVAAAPGGASVSATLFERDSSTAEVLTDIAHSLQQQHSAALAAHRQQLLLLQQSERQAAAATAAATTQQRGPPGRRRWGGGGEEQQLAQQQQQQLQQPPPPQPPAPRLAAPLLHACQASVLLGLSASAADVDLLLLSQLFQPGGLPLADLLPLSRQLAQQERQRERQPGRVPLEQELAPLAALQRLDGASLPRFPPPLRADVARAAVAAYARHGALARAAAVAHAAAVGNPRDLQQVHLLIRSQAAAGQLLPALVAMTKLREHLWQATTPTAQAAMLRALARGGAGPPLGAAPSPSRLMSIFRQHCTPHPKTWGALLQGMALAGDRGHRLLAVLRSAVAQPYGFMAMARFAPDAVDRGRSRLLAQLFRGVLAAPPGHGERLAAAAAAVAAAAAAGGGAADARLRAALAPPGTGGGATLALAPPAAPRGAQQPLPLAQQRPLPGVRLAEQPVHLRTQVVLVLGVLEVLGAWGVRLRHDAALAAALQVLRYCSDTDDARQSGLLVAVLRSSLGLGVRPGRASLRALLSCCADLESRPGRAPLGLAAGPGFELPGHGYVDLGRVLRAAQEALDEEQQQEQQEQGQQRGGGAPPTAAGAPPTAAGVPSAQQLAGELLRGWVFAATFDWADCVMEHGPAWALRGGSGAPGGGGGGGSAEGAAESSESSSAAAAAVA